MQPKCTQAMTFNALCLWRAESQVNMQMLLFSCPLPHFYVALLPCCHGLYVVSLSHNAATPPSFPLPPFHLVEPNQTKPKQTESHKSLACQFVSWVQLSWRPTDPKNVGQMCCDWSPHAFYIDTVKMWKFRALIWPQSKKAFMFIELFNLYFTSLSLDFRLLLSDLWL